MATAEVHEPSPAEGPPPGLAGGVESEMRRIEKDVRSGDAVGLRARWESGRYLLRQKKGKPLPQGMLSELAVKLAVHRSELTARMKFAAKYDTDEKVTDVISKYRTWFAITHRALTTTPRRREQQAGSPLHRVLELVENLDPQSFDRGARELIARIEEGIQRLKASLEMFEAAQ